ncbi:hypothetical protein [Yokenella regensburgei]|uniref:hypothetical protein n=1 Tax=Yokenella regensburgei TaxID=158877 RepID=UPI003F5CE496
MTFAGLKVRRLTARTIAARTIAMISNEQIQALQAQMKRKHRNWTASVMRTCDYCGHHKDTVTEDDGSAICASCCDAEYATILANVAETLLAERDADKALIADQAKRIDQLQGENEYIRKRFKETDLMFGKNLLVMQAAIIEWQGTGDAKNGLAWIYNTLFGPGELPDEAEKDAQAYFDRKYAPLDEELMALHQWFWEQSEAERAAAGITLTVGGEEK